MTTKEHTPTSYKTKHSKSFVLLLFTALFLSLGLSDKTKAADRDATVEVESKPSELRVLKRKAKVTPKKTKAKKSKAPKKSKKKKAKKTPKRKKAPRRKKKTTQPEAAPPVSGANPSTPLIEVPLTQAPNNSFTFYMMEACSNARLSQLLPEPAQNNLDLHALPGALSLAAYSDAPVASIVFTSTSSLPPVTDNSAPFTLFGDDGTDIFFGNFPEGIFTITATGYSGVGGTGDVLATGTIALNITSSSPLRASTATLPEQRVIPVPPSAVTINALKQVQSGCLAFSTLQPTSLNQPDVLTAYHLSGDPQSSSEWLPVSEINGFFSLSTLSSKGFGIGVEETQLKTAGLNGENLRSFDISSITTPFGLASAGSSAVINGYENTTLRGITQLRSTETGTTIQERYWDEPFEIAGISPTAAYIKHMKEPLMCGWESLVVLPASSTAATQVTVPQPFEPCTSIENTAITTDGNLIIVGVKVSDPEAAIQETVTSLALVTPSGEVKWKQTLPSSLTSTFNSVNGITVTASGTVVILYNSNSGVPSPGQTENPALLFISAADGTVRGTQELDISEEITGITSFSSDQIAVNTITTDFLTGDVKSSVVIIR
jgi:hypothetical protein